MKEARFSPTARASDSRDLQYGVLVIDAAGRVVAANTSARTLWHATAKSLVNLSVVQLLGSDAANTEGSLAEVQWQVLRSASLDRVIDVLVHPVDGSAPFDMHLRLERAHGGGGTYIATLTA